MVKRFHYDDVIYQNWLADRLSEQEQAKVSLHLEGCDSCQTKLESISQSELNWDEVQSYLRSDELHSRSKDSLNDPTKSQPNLVVDFLESSDEPNSIGRFARYEIREILGRGGMGIVMKGFDPALGRNSAIKVLAPELASNAAARQRFFREAKSAAAVIHDHVVPIQTVDEWSGLPYLLMPVVEGCSLQQHVGQDRGPLTLSEILRIGVQTAAGLDAAHAQGLVHRDVKPANILLENGVERVMISDFGLARAADDANITRSQVIAGTPQYMSPEQACGGDIDCRSDLFSLGSVLYFMCCGHAPFRANTTMGVLHRIVNDNPRSIRQLNPDIPDWLQAIIEGLLEKDPAKRFQSAGEVSDLLERWLAHVQQPESIAPPYSVKSRHSKRWPPVARWFVCLASLALLAAALGIIVLETNKGTITIQAASNDTKIRIKQGTDVVRELTVTKGSASTRIAAGEYVIEVEASTDEMIVENGTVELKRGGKWIAKVVETIDGDASAGDVSDDNKKNDLDSAAAALKAGYDSFQSAKYDEAIKFLEKAYAADRKNKKTATQSLLYLWCSYRNKDDLPKSIEIQNQLIKEFPDSDVIAYTKYFRGLNLLHSDKPIEANKSWDQVISEFPDSMEAENSRAMQKHAGLQKKLKQVSGNRKEADKIVREMEDVVLDGMEVEKLANIAGWEFGQQRFDEAERLFKKVLEKETDSIWAADALTHLANCSINKEDYKTAIDYLNQHLQDFPDQIGTPMALYQLGDCHSRLGNTDKAKASLEKLLRIAPNSAFAESGKKLLEKLND